jgi:hypothetical protein
MIGRSRVTAGSRGDEQIHPGFAAAIFVIRTVLVPAVMRVLGHMR